jgi:hypothetical protein
VSGMGVERNVSCCMHTHIPFNACVHVDLHIYIYIYIYIYAYIGVGV